MKDTRKYKRDEQWERKEKEIGKKEELKWEETRAWKGGGKMWY